MKVRVLLYLVAVGLIVAAGVYFWPTVQGFFAAEQPVAEPPPPELVEVTPLSPTDFELREPVAGLLQPFRATTLAFETAGQVAEVLVDLGDTVTEGQELVRLDTELLQTSAEQARLDADLAEKNLARARQLREGGVSTQEEFDQLQTQALLATQRAREAQIRLDRSIITSPFDGRVRQKFVEAQEYVTPGEPAVELLDLDPLKFSVTVPESGIANVKVGDPVRLQLRALGGGEREATVTRVAPGPAGDAPLYVVEINLPNPDGELLSGMLGTGYIVTGIVEDVWQVPLESLIVRRGQTACMIAMDGKSVLLPLKENFQQNRGFALVPVDEWPQVRELDSLPLITRGHKALREGAAVQVYEEAPLPDDPPAMETPAEL